MQIKNTIILVELILIIAMILLIISLTFNVSDYKNKLKTKTDSIESLLQYQDSINSLYVFEYVGVTALLSNNVVEVNDTLFAEVHLTAYNLKETSERNAFLVFQLLNDSEYNLINDPEEISRFFLSQVKTDTIILDSYCMPLSYSTSIAGNYYLRGVLFVPSLNNNLTESYIKLPFQRNIRFVN